MYFSEKQSSRKQHLAQREFGEQRGKRVFYQGDTFTALIHVKETKIGGETLPCTPSTGRGEFPVRKSCCPGFYGMLSRIWAGDELNSLVHSWFIALNTPS